MQRLSLEDLNDRHLYQLLHAAHYSVDAHAGDWVSDIAEGKVQVFEEEGILLGLRDLGEKVFVEFLVGRKAAKDPVGVTGKILELAGGRPVEAATKRPSVMRLMLKVGFQPTTVYMRYGYGGRS